MKGHQSEVITHKSKFQIVIIFLLFLLTYDLRFTTYDLFAQDENKLVALSKQIIEAKTNTELYPAFEELKELYLKENKYAEFVEFLKSLEAKKDTLAPFSNYYIALSRLRQLKYLEETQAWDEYFSQGNAYREEIVLGSKKAIDSTEIKEPLNIYARLLLWQFHSSQQDAFHEQALLDLMNATLEYSKDAGNLNPVKDAAEQLSAYGEKEKSKELCKVYIDKLAGLALKGSELADKAAGFYNENNLDLAEPLYDVYIDRVVKTTSKEELALILADIARQFLAKDPFYAEKVFKRMEEAATSASFNEELQYSRAFNLEKMKEYNQAKDIYLDLLKRFPKSKYASEADYKVGIIYTYILRNIEDGKGYFTKLAEESTPVPQKFSGLYQLGLLSQWKEDFAKAKEYYEKLILDAGNGFTEDVALAKERLKEINESRPIEYNLKTFLDVSLKGENAFFNTPQIDLKAPPYIAEKNNSLNVISTPPAIASGCMEVAVQYLWSGHLGTAKPSLGNPAFDVSYTESGTKEINLVVVSPSGVVGRSIIMLDIR